MGHADIQTTMIYVHHQPKAAAATSCLSSSRKRQALRRGHRGPVESPNKLTQNAISGFASVKPGRTQGTNIGSKTSVYAAFCLAPKSVPAAVTIISMTEAGLEQSAYATLYRASVLAGRPGIAVADEDFSALDVVSGARSRTRALIGRLEKAGRLRPIRRGAYTLVDGGGNTRSARSTWLPRSHETVRGYCRCGTPVPRTHRPALPAHRGARGNPAAILELQRQTVRYARTDQRLAGEAIRTRKTPAAIASPARAIADSLDHPSWGVTQAQTTEAPPPPPPPPPSTISCNAIRPSRTSWPSRWPSITVMRSHGDSGYW